MFESSDIKIIYRSGGIQRECFRSIRISGEITGFIAPDTIELPLKSSEKYATTIVRLLDSKEL